MRKNKKGLKKSFAKNSFWSLIYSTNSKIGALVFTIILARFLMPENYGNYSIVISTVMILNTLSDMGINNAATKYLSQTISKEKKKLSAYYRYLLKLKLLLTITLSFAILILAYPLSIYFFKNPSLITPFLLSSIFLFLLAIESFHTGILLAVEKIKYVSYKEIITQILRILMVFAVFYFIMENNQVSFIIGSLILTHIISLLFILFSIKNVAPIVYSPPKVNLNKKKIKKFISFLTITYVSGIFFSYLDSFVLGYFFSSEFVGFYRAAFNIIIGITGLIAFPNILLLPLFTKSNKLDSKKILETLFRYVAIITIPASFGLFVLGKYFLVLLYGYNYISSAFSLLFLCFLIPIISLVYIMIPLFPAKNKPHLLAKIVVITTILNLILDIIFAKIFISNPLYATAGIAFATLLSWGFYFLYTFKLTKKIFYKDLTLKVFAKPIISGIIMGVFLIYLLKFTKNVTFFSGIVMVIVGAIVYFTTLFLFKGFTKKDFELFLLLFNKK